MRIVRPDGHRVMPWKNGFGTTTEIAIDPPTADVGGRFRWRLSIADVERSGPFSAFPGYERTIMVIAGNGMDLAIGDRPAQRLDRLFEPFAFSGELWGRVPPARWADPRLQSDGRPIVVATASGGSAA